MSKLIYVEYDYDGQYGNFWGNLGDIVKDRKMFLARPQDFDLVCFTGGEDVSPELYGHQNLNSGNSLARDRREREVFEMADKYGIPMTGICRGSQFLNVMCGGTMVQHLRRSHGGGRHGCHTYDGQFFEVTSSHHQMNVPSEEAIILAWAEQRLLVSDCVYDGNLPQIVQEGNEENLKEDGEMMVRVTEAFAYPKRNIFAVQHHPEWQDLDEEAPQWTLMKIREFCFGETGDFLAPLKETPATS